MTKERSSKPEVHAVLLPKQRSFLPSKPDLNSLTGLRFFAAFSVVVYHFARPAVSGWPAPLINLANSGYSAVSFFFFLSGFILSYSYINQAGLLRSSRASFYSARFARVYPAYFLAFLLAAPHNISTSLHANSLAVGGSRLAFSALAALSLQQSWTPWTAWCWNFPAWSVSVEAFFYLTFPWIAPRIVSRFSLATCLRACGGLWVIAMIAPAIFVFLTGTTGAPELQDQMQKAIEFTPLLRLPEFLIGILLGRAFSLGLLTRFSGRSMPYLCLASIAGILAFLPEIPHPLLANGLLLPLFAGLIISLAQRRTLLSRLLSIRSLVLLGEASYGIYILQIPVAYLLRMPPPSQTLGQFGIYCAALLIASILCFHYVERPLRRYLRNLFAKKEPALLPRDLQWQQEPALHSSLPGYK